MAWSCSKHGKAYLFGNAPDARVALVTSANLTGAGLYANLELGVANYEPSVANQAGIPARRDRGEVPSGATLREAARAEAGETGLAAWVEQALEGDVDARSARDFDPDYGDAVRADHDQLAAIRDQLTGLEAPGDPKLAALLDVLENSPAAKIAVFSTFGATVRYLDEQLPAVVGGRERVVVIGNESTPDQRTGTPARFAPNTVVPPGYQPPDREIDLLISTDVLSEGQNLQQAQAVVSYDMP